MSYKLSFMHVGREFRAFAEKIIIEKESQIKKEQVEQSYRSRAKEALRNRVPNGQITKNAFTNLAKDFEHATTTLDLNGRSKEPRSEPTPVRVNKEGPRVTKEGIKQYYNSVGQLHRDNGPAVISPEGNQLWYQNGKLHREDGPAATFFNGTQKWFIDGKSVSAVDVLQLSFNNGRISTHDIETLKELADIAFFDYAKTDVRALKQAGQLLLERGLIHSHNLHIIVEFLKAAIKL